MKFVKYLAVLAMSISFNVMAAMSPSDIGKLIDSGQLTQAESALQDVLKERDTAKIHYMLAQVYQQMRRPLDAKNELAKADSMDPNHSYTTNDRYQAQAAKILGTTAPPVAAVRPGQGASPAQVQSSVTTASPGPSVGTMFLWFGTSVVGGLGLFFLFTIIRTAREKKRLKDELDGEITSLQSRAVRLVESVESATLNEKTSTKPYDKKIEALQVLKGKVLNVYDRAKNSMIDTIDDCSSLMRECQTLELRLNDVIFMAPSAASPAAPQDEFSERRTVPRRGAAKVTPKAAKVKAQQDNKWGHNSSAPSPQPQVIRETTVVHDHGGSTLNDVLVTSILLDGINRNDHLRQQQRDEDDRQQRRDEERRERERERQREQDDEDRRERQRVADNARQAREDREEENRRSTWSSPVSDSGPSNDWSSNDTPASDPGEKDEW